MTAVTFAPVATLPGQGNVFLTGVTDMCFGEAADGTPILYMTSGPGGGVAAYEMRGTSLSLIDQFSLPAQSTNGIDSMLVQIDMSGDPVALVTGVAATGLYGIGLDADGEMGARISFGLPLPADLLACAGVSIGGTNYVYGLRLGSDAISVWKVTANGDLAAVSTPQSNGSASGGPKLTDLTSIVRGGATCLLVASDCDDALISYRIGSNGIPTEVDRVWAAEGVGIASPSAVVAATVDGRAYAVLAASGTGTLTVAEVMAGGTLTVTDHVMDDLGTRFQGVCTLETITVDGRAYIVAAGADDGITLLQILPGGRLLEMGSLADATSTTLNNVSAVALAEQGGDLQIMVTSGSEPGVTWIRVDLGTAGQTLRGTFNAETLTGGSADDILAGGAGNDRLSGGAGNDIIIDEAGSDTLTGGAGNDTFVLSADNVADTITDFDSRTDRIDLSGWAMLRSPSQLTITTTAGGADIRYGEEVLHVLTLNGASLQPGMVRGFDLLNLSRLDPAWIPAVVPPQTLYGGSGSDTLLSSNGTDLLYGNGGNDALDGGFGHDRLYGGDGNDRINGEDGDDTLCGEAGDDVIRGMTGHDHLYGGAGHDTAWGGAETDFLWGGDGNDRTYGDAASDTIYGEAGDDWLYGGEGADLLAGGAGNDLLYGDAGLDLAYGGGGNDTLYGGGDSDRMAGDAGNDRLYGDAGADTLYGGTGNDMLKGQIGNDWLASDGGNDRVYGGGGVDRLWGGNGADTLWGDTGNDILYGGAGSDSLHGHDNNDILYGRAETDILYGEAGRDALYGEDGTDRLYGGTGNDMLYGGTGGDRLDGSSGNDWLRGGPGTDSFVFTGGDDRVLDYMNNTDMVIFDDALWGGKALTKAQILDFTKVYAGNTIFEFAGGHSLVIEGLTKPDQLLDDLGIM